MSNNKHPLNKFDILCPNESETNKVEIHAKGNKPDRHWNTRVLAVEHLGEVEFGIYEVYYKNGKPWLHTENPVQCLGTDINDLIGALDKKRAALNKPILWHGSRFPEEYKADKKSNKKAT